MSKLIEVTSFIPNPNYDEQNGLLLKNRNLKMQCLMNVAEVNFIVKQINKDAPELKDVNSIVYFRNGHKMSLAETIEEIAEKAADTKTKK